MSNMLVVAGFALACWVAGLLPVALVAIPVVLFFGLVASVQR
jgi:hypothetical protein